jgi:hypothetical protein
MKEIYEVEVDGPSDQSNLSATADNIKKTLEDAGFKCRVRFKSNRSFEEQAEYDLWESHLAAG